jgi:uncharacterized protein YcsI (UPF0317 family)
MNSKRARTLTILAILIALIAAGLSLFTIFSGDSQAPQTPASVSQNAPVPVQQPVTARDIAAKLGGTHFIPLQVTKPSLFGITDQGNFWIGSTKYCVETFGSVESRDARVKVMAAFGIVPKWMTATSIVYLSTKPGPPPSV